MKQIGLSILTALAVLAAGSPAPAQVAGTTTVGVTVAEMKEVMLGWSAKKQFLGKPLYNDKGEKVGSIDDVIIGPDKTSVSYVIVGAGGFAGLGKHDVAIGDHAQIAMQSVRGIEHDGRRPCAGESGGDFCADLSGFPDTENDNFPSGIDRFLNQLDRTGEIFAQTLPEPLELKNFYIQDTCSLFKVVHRTI